MAKYSIGAKIFAAFVAMSLIIAATGFAGYLVLSAAGNIAVVTYDGPLMAISYSRAAHADFIQMQALEQRIEHADPSQDAALASEMDDMAATFSGDLDVAASRASAPDEHRLIEQIGPWSSAGARHAPMGTRHHLPAWKTRSTRNSIS